jgi:transcriptional regulator with XRE-family HTH domain
MTDLDMIAQAIARNVRRLRSGRGFTLDVLASRAGVSRGMLIQIEQARTNPSVATLVRVADALGVSVAQLVEVSDAPAVRVVRAADAAPLWRASEGSVGTLLIGSDHPPPIELWDWRLEPGDGYDGAAHLPGTCELLYVIAGELTLAVGSEAHTLQAGDAVMFRADREHRYSNGSEAPTRFALVVSMPARGIEGGGATG